MRSAPDQAAPAAPRQGRLVCPGLQDPIRMAPSPHAYTPDTSVHTNLVDFVDEDQGILCPDLLETLDELAGHRPDVRPPVALDLRDVCHAPHAEPVELHTPTSRLHHKPEGVLLCQAPMHPNPSERPLASTRLAVQGTGYRVGDTRLANAWGVRRAIRTSFTRRALSGCILNLPGGPHRHRILP